MLKLSDRWIWDFWLAEHEGLFHVYFLQAPRALQDPQLRHQNATIGHAISRDLRSWEVQTDAIRQGANGAFDDLATWTGSVIRTPEGNWLMFYSGISKADDGNVQRIGAAESSDLFHWSKVDGLLIEADERWYEKLDGITKSEAWRDPWVLRGPDRRYHMFVAARANHGPMNGRGVIGYASSGDLWHWEVGPPVTEPGSRLEMELPQVEWIGGRFRLFFSYADWFQTPRTHQNALAESSGGTYYLSADRLLGPYRLGPGEPLIASPRDGRISYGGRLVRYRGSWHVLTWLFAAPDGGFIGELGDPLEVVVAPSGHLEVRESPARRP